MRAYRLVVQFFFVSLLLCVLLNQPWPGLRTAYGVTFRLAANAMLGRIGTLGRVRFESTPNRGSYDVDAVLVKRGVAEVPTALDSLSVGYFPTTILVAFVLAAPVPWSRKWRAMVWGLLLVELFVILRTGLMCLYYFSIPPPNPVRLFEPGPWMQKLIDSSYEFFFVAPTCGWLVPLVIWILVTFRVDDVNRILQSSLSPAVEPRDTHLPDA